MSRFASVRIDPGIVRRLAAGDRKAQEIVYRAYADTVYTMARRVLRDATQAEEVTQDTFVDMIERAAQLRSPDALGGWLRSIAVNRCRMRLRSPWHERREPLTDDLRSVSDGVGRALDIDAALGRLPRQARLIVWLYCVEGYTHQEIGRVFGHTASFSKSKLARALSDLKRHNSQLSTDAGGRRDGQSLAAVATCAS